MLQQHEESSEKPQEKQPKRLHGRTQQLQAGEVKTPRWEHRIRPALVAATSAYLVPKAQCTLWSWILTPKIFMEDAIGACCCRYQAVAWNLIPDS